MWATTAFLRVAGVHILGRKGKGRKKIKGKIPIGGKWGGLQRFHKRLSVIGGGGKKTDETRRELAIELLWEGKEKPPR